MNSIELSTKDVYQLLISECRYGYTRNNHLMPQCAWDRAEELLPKMYETDQDCALRTAKQLCEECISDELNIRFYDGLDDENGNRKQAIAFVRWCVEFVDKAIGAWKPYNWEDFECNVAKDDLPRYMAYEVIDGEKTPITEKPVSYNECIKLIFSDDNLDERGRATYHHIVLRDFDDFATPYAKAPVKYEFTEPTRRIYIMEYTENE